MKSWLRKLFIRAVKRLTPKPDQSTQLAEARTREKFLVDKLAEIAQAEALRDAESAFQRMSEDLIEAQAIAGAGPWKIGPEAMQATESLTKRLRESFNLRVKEDIGVNVQGAYGDVDLMLSTIDWRREINFSVLQFSRWGIQQIILIMRLYWLKNPIVQRLINVCAAYVFARDFEVTTDDDSANETLKEFFETNRKVFGHTAMVQHERAKDTDGNLFFCLFPDKVNTGKVKARMIDATEISEIVSNPDDADEPWLYLRIWTQMNVDVATGTISNKTEHAWYPAMGYEPDESFDTFRGWPVLWNAVVHHRKCGQPGKWQFGCPRAYAMIDWAKEARRYLEACASVAQQLAQIALTFTTKGGQQAIEGFKNQIGTTVGPTANLWDQNPPAVPGGLAAMGTGSKLEAFKTQGAGVDPEKVRQYKLMCCMVKGASETFLADVSTGNLATATSLDRPFEITILECQEAWTEDLQIIARYVLETSAGAAKGRLSEAREWGVKINIVECSKKRLASGKLVYEAFKKQPGTIEVKVNWPDIREGDRKANVDAIVESMTLGNKAGQIIGLDEKVGVVALYNALDIEGGDEIAERQYPEKGENAYDPDRTKEILPAPLMKPKPAPGGQPQIDPATGQPTAPAPQAPPLGEDKAVKEALARVKEALNGRD